MATPEKKVKDRAKRILDKLGAYHFSPATGYGGRKGVPDIIACYEGKFFGIECKAGKNKPTTESEELERLLLGNKEGQDMTHWALQNIS